MDHTHMSLHVILIVLLNPHGAQERGCTVCVRSVLLSGWSGCWAVSAAVRPLCAIGLSGSCQAVKLGPDSDGSPSDVRLCSSAVRLSETCCQAVGKSAVSAVSAVGHCQALNALSGGLLSGCQTRAQGRSCRCAVGKTVRVRAAEKARSARSWGQAPRMARSERES